MLVVFREHPWEVCEGEEEDGLRGQIRVWLAIRHHARTPRRKQRVMKSTLGSFSFCCWLSTLKLEWQPYPPISLMVGFSRASWVICKDSKLKLDWSWSWNVIPDCKRAGSRGTIGPVVDVGNRADKSWWNADMGGAVTQLAGNTMTMVMTDPAPKMVGFCNDATKHWN